MREDGFIGTYCDKDGKGIPRPYWGGSHRGIPLLCFNGSGPLRPSHPWTFSVPGVALLKSLLQTAIILNANTVLPRVAAMQLAFQRRAQGAEQPSEFDPVNRCRPHRSSGNISSLHVRLPARFEPTNHPRI